VCVSQVEDHLFHPQTERYRHRRILMEEEDRIIITIMTSPLGHNGTFKRRLFEAPPPNKAQIGQCFLVFCR